MGMSIRVRDRFRSETQEKPNSIAVREKIIFCFLSRLSGMVNFYAGDGIFSWFLSANMSTSRTRNISSCPTTLNSGQMALAYISDGKSALTASSPTAKQLIREVSFNRLAVSLLRGAKRDSQERDRIAVLSGTKKQGDLFLIRPEIARSAKVEYKD
jgi:hypothetical protein